MAIPTDCSWKLRQVLKLRPLACHYLSFHLGDGQQTVLWFDPWYNNECIATSKLDPIISQANLSPNTRVHELIRTGQWILPRPNPRHHHSHSLLQWISSFTYPSFDLQKQDTITWDNTPLSKLKTGHIWDATRFKIPEISWHDLVRHKLPHHQVCTLFLAPLLRQIAYVKQISFLWASNCTNMFLVCWLY